MKPINPYVRLLDDIKSFCNKLKFAHTRTQFFWRKDKLARSNGWDLLPVWERIQAAELLGYNAVLTAEDDGLRLKFVKKVDIPYSWQ